MLLVATAAVALIWANSPWGEVYTGLTEFRIGPAALHLDRTLAQWAADGLLAIFFFVAVLELKREFVAATSANPAVRIYTSGHPPESATARILDQDEADRALAAYSHRHPGAWSTFKPVLEQTLGQPIDMTNTALPMVELRLDRAGHS